MNSMKMLQFHLIQYIQQSTPPNASIGGCCSHKVVALGFNTLCYDTERLGIKPSARIKAGIFGKISSQTHLRRRGNKNSDKELGIARYTPIKQFMICPKKQNIESG